MYFVSSYPGEQDTPIENPDTGEEQGIYSQQLIVNYQDGTKSNDLITGWMYHDHNIIESMTYTLFVTPEETAEMMMNYYYFKYRVTQNTELIKEGRRDVDTVNQQANGRTKIVETTFDAFEFINYTYPDGVYTITIIPNGEIWMNGEQVNLPDDFSFTVEMIDERSVDIGFS